MLDPPFTQPLFLHLRNEAQSTCPCSRSSLHHGPDWIDLVDPWPSGVHSALGTCCTGRLSPSAAFSSWKAYTLGGFCQSWTDDDAQKLSHMLTLHSNALSHEKRCAGWIMCYNPSCKNTKALCAHSCVVCMLILAGSAPLITRPT